MRGPSANENPERIVVVFHEENSRAAPYITSCFCFVLFSFFRPWQRTMRWTNKSRFLKRTKASAALLASSLQSEMCVNRIRYTVAFTQPSYKIRLVFFLFFIWYFSLFFFFWVVLYIYTSRPCQNGILMTIMEVWPVGTSATQFKASEIKPEKGRWESHSIMSCLA